MVSVCLLFFLVGSEFDFFSGISNSSCSNSSYSGSTIGSFLSSNCSVGNSAESIIDISVISIISSSTKSFSADQPCSTSEDDSIYDDKSSTSSVSNVDIETISSIPAFSIAISFSVDSDNVSCDDSGSSDITESISFLLSDKNYFLRMRKIRANYAKKQSFIIRCVVICY